jgi:hypothetical protein
VRSGRTWLLGIIAFVVLLAVTACGSSSQQAGTPGFDDNQKKVDKSPFEMANPTTTAGPTTIPGAAPTLPLPTTTDASGNSARVGSPPDVTAAPRQGANPFAPSGPATTTTTPVQLLPAPPDGTFCGYSAYLQSMLSVLTNPSIDVKGTVTAATQVIRRLNPLAPAAARNDVETVSNKVLGLIDMLASLNYNVNDPSFRAATNPLIARTPDVRPFIDAYDRVSAAEASVCPTG